MKTNTELTSLLSGVAGEYYVAAELSARGYMASITLRNTKGVDILCSNDDASKTVAIQVKTNKHSNREWVLNEKCEKNQAENFFYVLVNLNDMEKAPDYFVIPSKTVADQAIKSHRDWLDAPGRKGQAHKDNTMRKFKDTDEEYLNRWDLLGL
ncbi:MAG: hypothetical protein WCI63_03140 [bacterium]